MNGGRQLFTCPECGKWFFYWVPENLAQPKVKCYFCSAETFPNGEPPPRSRAGTRSGTCAGTHSRLSASSRTCAGGLVRGSTAPVAAPPGGDPPPAH